MDEQSSNYYELLGLNPSEPWNEEIFKKVLNAKQKQWSRESMGIGPDALSARRNLDLLPEIRQAMNDPHMRARQMQRAKSARGQERQERLIAFEQALAEKESKGYLEEAELQALVRQFQDVVREDEIIAQLNVPLKGLQEEKLEEVQEADGVVFQDIAENLALIQIENLYQLLGQPAGAPLATLSHEAEQLFYEMMQRQPKTVEVTIKMRLAGHAKSIFSDKVRQQKYDAYLTQILSERAARAPHISLTQETPSADTNTIVSADGSGLAQSNTPSQKETLKRLKVQNLGRVLRLTWSWPDSCNEVWISYSSDEWPRPESGVGRTIKVTRAYYEDRGGHYDLQVPPIQRYFLVVTPILWRAGKASTAPDVRVEAYLMPQATISYEIKNPRLGFKDRTFHLYITPPAIIPTLLLVSKRNGQPLHKDDGELLHRETGPLYISLAETIIKLPETQFPANTFARLFLEDETLYSVIIIYHPHEKKLRLGK